MDTQDSVVLGAPECSRAPGGEWCSAPIGSTTITTTEIRQPETHFDAEAIRQEIAERLEAGLVQTALRLASKRSQRQQFATRRNIGLRHRHAEKLARLEKKP